MPPLAIGIAGAVVAGLGAAAAGATLAVSVAIGVATFALGQISQALAPKPPKPGSVGSFAEQAAARTTMIRQPITARRLPVGEVIVGGVLTFYEATDGNRFHHMVVTLGDAPAAPWEAIPIVWLDDTPIFDIDFDGGAAGGDVIDGKYAGKVRVNKHLGGPDQTADENLIAAIDRLDENFRGRGVAYLYLRVEWDRSTFPNGLPQIRALCRTNKPLDPRDGQRRFTPNAALALREYLTEPEVGLGYPVGDLSSAHANAAANVSDEIVDSRPVGHAVVARGGGGADGLELATAGPGAALRFETGDRVEIFTDGTPPGGLSVGTPYFAIVDRLVATPFEDADATTIALDPTDYTGAAAEAIDAGDVDAVAAFNVGHRARVEFAASYAAALARTAIPLSSDGTGQHVVIKTGEPRYTAAGVIETDRTPKENIEDLLSAMAGRLVWTGGEFRLLPAAWREPTLDLDERDLMGPLTVRTRHSRRERFNAVKGIFATHLTVGEPTDYPPVIDQGFIDADGGNRIFADLDMPTISRAAAAQRVAKIALARHRREITVDFPTTLKGIDAVPGTVVRLSNARRGWVNKPFEVLEQEDTLYGDGEPQVQGVVLKLAETDATVYEFDPDSDETVKAPVPLAPGGNPLTAAAPGVPSIVERLFVTRDGAGVKALAEISWGAADDAFVEEYQVEGRRLDGPGGTPIEEFLLFGRTPETMFEQRDIDPAIWEFRVKAINQLGVESDYATREQQIFGLPAAPQALGTVTIGALGGLAVLSWPQSPDLDVRIGGRILIRHSALQSGATWVTGVTIADAVPGAATEAVVPLKPGSYLVRARDSSGTMGPVSVVSTKGAQVIAFANVDSLQEDPTFPGTKTDTVVVDNTLRLDTDGGGVLASGSYDFGAGLDFLTVQTVRLRSEIAVTVLNTGDLISARGLVSTWESIVGDQDGPADAVVEVRATDDDPAGSPVWGPWERLHSLEIEARAIEARARLSSEDPLYNIHVSELRVHADEVA